MGAIGNEKSKSDIKETLKEFNNFIEDEKEKYLKINTMSQIKGIIIKKERVV